ncbi:hypothetical protein [Haladaptatus sp. W1]|uniref:hypothetical protein n=1 Tax=Haladaptatus sp. W1 TaxID=1897478 RepID=UPI0009F2AB96|nr:hypothetical protein [Haladaptatus sp. W1]
MTFDVDTPGRVEVTTESHENPADHQYVVSIDDVTNALMACTCPHHVHRNAVCKHMPAVDNTTDDGTLDAFSSGDNDEDTDPEDCDCDGLGGFPCWPCVRTGRKELPNEPPLQSFSAIFCQLMTSDDSDQLNMSHLNGIDFPVSF